MHGFLIEFKEGGNVLGKVSISISEEDGPSCTAQQDRPRRRRWCKDKLVQLFKRNGSNAKARVLGFDTRDTPKKKKKAILKNVTTST